MKAFVFLADGFEEMEAIAPIDILRRADIQVITISISTKKEVLSGHGLTVIADSLFSDTDFSSNDLLYLPGGMPGTKNLDAHKGLKKLLRKQVEQGKILAAICAAPSIPGKMNKIVKSGTILTAMGAGVAIQFAIRLVEELKGKTAAEHVASSICLD